MFIAFSGIDGAGKTTIINAIERWLRSEGYNVNSMKSVKGDSIYCNNFEKIISNYKKTYSENFPGKYGSIILAFKLFQESEEIKSFSRDNNIILMDRWKLCHDAYSSAYLLNSKALKSILDNCIEPDITFLIDVNLSVALERISQRDVIKKQETYPVLYRAKKRYLQAAKEKNNIFLIGNSDGELNEAIEKIKIIIIKYLGNHNLVKSV
ncbi:dTMP kinase [Robertmurraya kyonggiensis]|uniref:dTMP kinase n=1 Tax=Robertmurraya kyonggiensis TaxID=1037680 RepID=UPI00130D98F6|nr:dTMP kinase [Robertmurraya kyonggiensis]